MSCQPVQLPPACVAQQPFAQGGPVTSTATAPVAPAAPTPTAPPTGVTPPGGTTPTTPPPTSSGSTTATANVAGANGGPQNGGPLTIESALRELVPVLEQAKTAVGNLLTAYTNQANSGALGGPNLALKGCAPALQTPGC
jgi:hypothetical protein